MSECTFGLELACAMLLNRRSEKRVVQMLGTQANLFLHWANFGRNFPNSAELASKRSNSGQLSASVGQLRQNIDQFSPDSLRFGPKSIGLWAMSTNTDRPGIDQRRPGIDQNTLHVGNLWADFGHLWPDIVSVFT